MTSEYAHFDEIRATVAKHATDGLIVATPVSGLHLHRCSAPTTPTHAAYGPTLNLVVQGAKRLQLGKDCYSYGVGQYLLTSVELPVTTWVVEATGEVPYLCVSVEISTDLVRELSRWRAKPLNAEVSQSARALSVHAVSPGLVDAVCRKMRLLEAPQDVETLGPLIDREIIHRLLSGPDGWRLTEMASVDSQSNKISRAVGWLRENFRQQFVMEDLLNLVGMSASSFHRHFKAVAAVSPLDFQKRLRLHEARRLMMIDGLTAGDAGFRVGYQSQSQFGREYLRLYGVSPAKDRRGGK